jgi:hypothetical protein
MLPLGKIVKLINTYDTLDPLLNHQPAEKFIHRCIGVSPDIFEQLVDYNTFLPIGGMLGYEIRRLCKSYKTAYKKNPQRATAQCARVLALYDFKINQMVCFENTEFKIDRNCPLTCNWICTSNKDPKPQYAYSRFDSQAVLEQMETKYKMKASEITNPLAALRFLNNYNELPWQGYLLREIPDRLLALLCNIVDSTHVLGWISDMYFWLHHENFKPIKIKLLILLSQDRINKILHPHRYPSTIKNSHNASAIRRLVLSDHLRKHLSVTELNFVKIALRGLY